MEDDAFVDDFDVDDAGAWSDDDEQQLQHKHDVAALNTSEGGSKERYVLHSPEAIVRLMQLVLSEVSDFLNVDADSALLLLLQYNWQQTRLLNDWAADSAAVRRKSGLGAEQRTSSNSKSIAATVAAGCLICGDDATQFDSDIVTLEQQLRCSHAACYCLSCWARWIQSQHESRGTAVCLQQRVMCMAEKCDTALSVKVQKWLMSRDDSSSSSAIDNYIHTSFVQSRNSSTGTKKSRSGSNSHGNSTGCGLLSACVGADCMITAEAKIGDNNINLHQPLSVGTVLCTACSSEFCFECRSGESHTPASCSDTQRWTAKNSSASENSEYTATAAAA